MKPASDAAGIVLAPLLTALGPGRADVVRAAVSEGLIAVAPLLNLWLEETRVAEVEAETAARQAGDLSRLADLVDVELARAIAREEERWGMILDAALSIGTRGANADALVGALGLDGPVTSQSAFDELMRDPDGILALPDARGRAKTASVPDLSLFGRRETRPPASAAAMRAFGTAVGATDRLANGAGCGDCLRGAAGDAVLLGDGTAVTVQNGCYVIARPAAGSSWRTVSVFRVASGGPPTLLPSARAALASCLAKRASTAAPVAAHFAPQLMLGAAVEGDSTPTRVLARIARLIRDLADAEGPDAIAAPLLEIASLVFRVHVRLTPGRVPGNRGAVGRPIDVGRVRWCVMSDSPRFWIPLGSDDRDVIGGIDRPWTRDIPAAAARWQSTPSSMRLDPEWYARIVVLPGESNLWCVDPDGIWWSLDSDFDAVLESRCAQLQPWLDALEQFGVLMPAQIAQARQRASGTRKPSPSLTAGKSSSQKRISTRTTSNRRESQPFSREWVLEVAGRYTYGNDEHARAAGARAASAGRYSRKDFLTVVRWKSPRALPLAAKNTSAEVVRATTAALGSASELERITWLLKLRGVGVPVASALLHFAFPNRYPILDYRALSSLGDKSRRTQYTPSFWDDYVQRCRGMARELGVSLRDLDKALWQHSRESDQ